MASDTTTQEFQPRYIAYAKANFRTPQEQRVHDGGRMAGFMLWIGAQWREWRTEAALSAATPMTDAHHVAFDAWLAERYEVRT